MRGCQRLIGVRGCQRLIGVRGCQRLIGVEVASVCLPEGGGGLGCSSGGSFSGRGMPSASGLFGVGAGAGRRCGGCGAAIVGGGVNSPCSGFAVDPRGIFFALGLREL